MNTFAVLPTLYVYLHDYLLLWVLLLTLLTFSIHGSSIAVLDRHFSQTQTKRAVKEQRRAYINTIFDDGIHVLRGIHGHFTLKWRKTLAPDDIFVQRLCTVHDAVLFLFPFCAAVMLLGFRLTVCAWLALPILLAAAAVQIWLALLCAQMPNPKPDHARKTAQYAHKVPLAYFLRYGYSYAALGCLIFDQLFFAGLLLIAEGIHLLYARAVQADHFYCAMQNIHHLPMTPHHHSERQREKYDREGRSLAVIGLTFGAALMLLTPIAAWIDRL